MNDRINNEEMLDGLCDGVRFAISVGDELTEEQKKHLEKCNECRTFFEQSKIMAKELSEMGVASFVKDGKSVADSVMEEINRQAVFTKGPAKKTKFAFFTRHAGLIAAGVALVIMAVPLVQNLLSSQKKDYITASERKKDYKTEGQLIANEPSASGYTFTTDKDGGNGGTNVAFYSAPKAEEESSRKYAFYSSPAEEFSAESANEVLEEAALPEAESAAEDSEVYLADIADGVLFRAEVAKEVSDAAPEYAADKNDNFDDAVTGGDDYSQDVESNSSAFLQNSDFGGKTDYLEIPFNEPAEIESGDAEEYAAPGGLLLSTVKSDSDDNSSAYLAYAAAEEYLLGKGITGALELHETVAYETETYYKYTVVSDSGNVGITVVVKHRDGISEVTDVFEG